MSEYFRKFSEAVSRAAGAPPAFVIAMLVIVVWLVTGPIFHFSDTWQLIINTGTTIVTFLMVFLLQNTQNREARATQIKLDELLRAIRSARTSLVDLEDLPDEELDRLEQEFRQVSERASATRKKRRTRKQGPDSAEKAVEDRGARKSG
jgi:low affinity Fe/Cu permease